MARISVTIVTFDSERDLPRCLDSLAAQSELPFEVQVVDNASRDASAEIARAHPVVGGVEPNPVNRGFAAAQNQAIAATRGDWNLTLNPDVVLAPSFLSELSAAIARSAGASVPAGATLPRPLGALCGKLLRLGRDGHPIDPATIDSTGIVFTRDFRHLDRGADERDLGQWGTLEPVFGASAAAALYRRDMIEDLRVEGEFFDESFFAYREDADVAWRAQLLGWDCLYVPSAVGHHVRRVTPLVRSELPGEINRHSVKNRFLMRIKNADADVWRRCAVRGLARDLVVVGGCVAWEWSSLGAFPDVLRLLPRARRQRREIQARRRRGGPEIARWFT